MSDVLSGVCGYADGAGGFMGEGSVERRGGAVGENGGG